MMGCVDCKEMTNSCHAWTLAEPGEKVRENLMSYALCHKCVASEKKQKKNLEALKEQLNPGET